MPLSEIQSLLSQNAHDNENCLQQLAVYLERGEHNQELVRLIETYHYQILRHEEKIRQLLAGAPVQPRPDSPSHDENLIETMGRW